MKKHWLKPFGLLMLLTCMMLSLQPVFAAGGTGSGTISLTTLGVASEQDFDTLLNTGTDIDMNISGWYIYEDSTGGAADGQYRAGTGSANNGDSYSFGAESSSERALGSLRSGTVLPSFGASFTNNTGSAINSVDIDYTGEMWRLGTVDRVDTLDFQYSTDATSLTDGTWTDFNDLDFTSPDTTTPTGQKDGNSEDYQTEFSDTIESLNIPNGATFWIRWVDADASGADDGLAVDDFSITPQASGPVDPVINEFSANTVGSTDVEYIEIFGAPNTDLSALTVLGIEGDSGFGVIDNVYQVGTTDSSGFYLFNLANGDLENGTITFLLVEGFTGAQGNDLDTDDDGTFDTTPWTSIVDSVAVHDGGASDITYATPVLGVAYDGFSFAPGGASRIPNGVDTDAVADWVRNDFDLAGIPPNDGTPIFGEAFNTPGATNEAVPADPAPTVSSTYPADNAGSIPVDADIIINFSEDVTLSNPWVSISCTVSGSHTAVVTGGPASYTINPDTDFAPTENCTVTITATQVADKDGAADNMEADYVFDFTTITPSCGTGTITPIHDIQGNTLASPEAGNVHTIEGIVVGDYQQVGTVWNLRGFFVQEEDLDVDADDATSEGIFVFDGATPAVDVQLGDKVRVTGTVTESFDLTELASITHVEVCATGGTVTAATVSLPFSNPDYPERYEGMLVTFSQELFVTETFELGRFGEVWLSSGDRLPIPTHAADPGVAAEAVEDSNALNRILLDDGQTLQNPDPLIYPDPGLTATNTLRGGDSTTGLTGVMTFSWGGNDASPDSYRIHPIAPVTWTHNNLRSETPPDVGGTLKVASFNVLNYFIGPFPTSRGANTAEEFERQHDKIVSAIAAMDADIVGLIELENHSGANPAGDGADPVLESLVDGLNAVMGAGTYDFIDTGLIGTDEIRQAFIYKPATVEPVGDFALLDESFDSDYNTSRNRPALAQTFKEIANDEVLTVVVNHLKSKGSGCGGGDDQPDSGGGNCNGTRTAAAEVMVDWLATDPTSSGDPDFLIIGDLNSYAKEDPIDALVAGGYTDLADSLVWLGGRYSYVFDGEWGYLDYGMSGATLTPQVAGAAAWHINSDEPPVLDYNTEFKSAGQITSFYDDGPFRASDHDPILIGLNLGATDDTPPTVTINQASGQDDPTSTSPINFTVVFSEEVTGFGNDDVVLSGTAGATTAVVTEISPFNGTTYNVAVSGMTSNGTVIASVMAGAAKDLSDNESAASTSDDNTVTYQEEVTPASSIFISTKAPGNVGGTSYGSEDILGWNGSAWSVWFDGSETGLQAKGAKHNVNAFYIPDTSGDEVILSFAQNSRKLPGITGKVDGMDLVMWDGSAYSLYFDGSDVGLTVKTQEKIDALHIMPDDYPSPLPVDCLAGYMLISTQGPGKVPAFGGGQLKFSGEDILGFCATNLGDTTEGWWHMVLDGSEYNLPKNSIVSLSANGDGSVIAFTTSKKINVNNANGGHSMVYLYDTTSHLFSGPIFSAPAEGITKQVDGLHFLPN